MKRSKVFLKTLSIITIVLLLIISTVQVSAYPRKIRFPRKFFRKTPHSSRAWRKHSGKRPHISSRAWQKRSSHRKIFRKFDRGSNETGWKRFAKRTFTPKQREKRRKNRAKARMLYTVITQLRNLALTPKNPDIKNVHKEKTANAETAIALKYEQIKIFVQEGTILSPKQYLHSLQTLRL